MIIQKRCTIICLFFICLLNLQAGFGQLNVNWAQSIGSNINNGYNQIFTSAICMENSMVVIGQADTSTDFDPGPGVYKLNNLSFFVLFIARYDTAGNFIYARTLPDTSWGAHADFHVYKVVCDSHGNTYVILEFNAFNIGPGQSSGMGIHRVNTTVYDSLPKGKFRNLILKYDANGNCVSVKKMAIGVGMLDAIVDHHDNLIISGHFGEYLATVTKDLQPGPGVSLFTATGPDAFITKLNPAGHLTFIKVLHYVYTGPYNGVYAEIYPFTLAVDSKDNIFFSVYLNGLYDVDPGPDTSLVHAAYASKNENSNYIFEKLDSSGNFMYRKKFFNTQFGMGLKMDMHDNIILYGGLNAPIDIDPSNNNTVILSPTGYSSDMLFAKFNNNGQYQYSKLLNSNAFNAENQMYDFHITGNNKFFFYASFEDSIALSPMGIPNIGQCNIYGKRVIVQMDTLFNAFYFSEISNSYDSSSYYGRILSGSQNDLYLCGSYSGRFDADFGPDSLFLENPYVNPGYSIRSMVISKYQFPSNLREYSPGESMTDNWIFENGENDFDFYLFPNPTRGNFKITCRVPQNNIAVFEMFNTEGRKVFSCLLSSQSKHTISLPGLTNGIYNCIMRSDGWMVSKKLALVHD